ncbi:MAG: hypothetical protein MI922_14060 [Bacteroidales bacterium]|nr:hypothetical protein [Bacteroidales bacterium]
MSTSYKTPGVYVKEISTFPPSVAQVETAIPAFIGHTEKAENSEGTDLTDIPTKISSLLEYEELFGSGYDVLNYTITVDTGSDNAIDAVEPDKRFYLYDALRHFYDNGGGDCYIVSVEGYDKPVSYTNLKGGLDELKKYDEPTLILFPDAVKLKSGTDIDYVNFGNLQKDALAQCNDLQDRFVIMDIIDGYNEEDSTNTPLTDFRDNIGTSYLKYGAVYYPWLYASYTPDVGFHQLKFQDKTPTDITDLTSFSNSDTDLETMVSNLEAKTADVNSIISTIDNSANIPLLRDTQPVADYYKSLVRSIAANSSLITNTTTLMNLLRQMALVYNALDGNVEEDLQKDIDALKNDTDLVNAIIKLVSLEKNTSVMALTTAQRVWTGGSDDQDAKYGVLDGTKWIAPNATVDAIAVHATDFSSGNTGKNINLALITELEDVIAKLDSTLISFFDSAQFYETQDEKDVFDNHPFFKGVLDNIYKKMQMLPPSGAMAGIYSAVDNARGVWKAPANVSVNYVTGPVVKLNEKEQADLNVHSTGKSINAIRAFTGKGTLVWGARTLAGNDNEWRYVPVRRFYNMVEESVKKASEPFVFEPNDANTWVKLRSMITNYLTVLWRQGALAGAKADEAFFVKVGLGETMTSLDILEGRMNIEIGMAVVRPAEFIVLKFSHLMAQ